VDASILPGPPTGFPHLITLMMPDSRRASGLAGSHCLKSRSAAGG
jgi:hypothetical protein